MFIYATFISFIIIKQRITTRYLLYAADRFLRLELKKKRKIILLKNLLLVFSHESRQGLFNKMKITRREILNSFCIGLIIF